MGNLEVSSQELLPPTLVQTRPCLVRRSRAGWQPEAMCRRLGLRFVLNAEAVTWGLPGYNRKRLGNAKAGLPGCVEVTYEAAHLTRKAGSEMSTDVQPAGVTVTGGLCLDLPFSDSHSLASLHYLCRKRGFALNVLGSFPTASKGSGWGKTVI